MKKTLLAILVAAPLALTLSGCVISVNDGEVDHSWGSDSQDRVTKNRDQIANAELGANFAVLRKKLGVADFSETYSKGDDTVKVIYYRTQRLHKDGLTTKDECTYLYFVNDALIETGSGGDFSRNTKG
jgi:hypothetical protein